jgi:hypothetical protein
MDRRLVFLAIMAAWMLWRETLLPNTPSPPSWHLEGEFSSEITCHEARNIHLIEQLLRADNGGPTIVNQPTMQEGTIWIQWPDGQRSRIRFFCIPETIDPREPWS